MKVNSGYEKNKQKKINKQKQTKINIRNKMIKNVSVDAKSTLEKEKNINEEKNKEYETMRNRVNMFKVYEHLANEEEEEDEDYWKERPFEDLQELINDSERDNEEWRRAKALPAKVQIFSNNKMENKMSVDDSTQVGCEVKDNEEVEDVEEEEEYNEMENEVTFYLKEDTTFRISAIGKWRENSRGEIIGDADTYFYHITTGQRCENVRDCFLGWSEQDEEDTEKWETLCDRIEACSNLEEIILNGNTIDL